MSPLNFCYWLQGWLEIGRPREISAQQVTEIKNHLKIIEEPYYGLSKAIEPRQERYLNGQILNDAVYNSPAVNRYTPIDRVLTTASTDASQLNNRYSDIISPQESIANYGYAAVAPAPTHPYPINTSINESVVVC